MLNTHLTKGVEGLVEKNLSTNLDTRKKVTIDKTMLISVLKS
jgi:hypothetical protein